MNIDIREQNIQINIVSLRDRFDVFSAPQLREQLNQLFEAGLSRLVFDLTEVTFFDSAAMAVLVSALKRSRQLGGDVVLVWPKADEARRIFHLTKFDRVFTMTDSVESARRELGVSA